jgi:hypothetical protein
LFPQTISNICYLVFKDPVKLAPSPLRQERENIEGRPLCQYFSYYFFLFSVYHTSQTIYARQANGAYTDQPEYCQDSFTFSRNFFSYFPTTATKQKALSLSRQGFSK